MIDEAKAYVAPNKEISRAALKVAIGGVFSLLAGLASQILTAYLFGADAEMDAFYTALTVPLYLQIVLLGGLPFVIIPAFVHEQSEGREEDAWGLTGSMLWISTVVLLITAIVGVLFSSQLIALFAPGYDADKARLASQMQSILMFTVPFTGLGTFTAGVENTRGRFFWPATATAVGSVGNVIALLVLQPLVGPLALAWGNLISTILIAAITTIPVLMHGWKRLLPISDHRLREMLTLIAPFIIFGLITNSKLILERYFASPLPDGQLAYLGYAYKIANIFIILLATSIASAIFPTMARAFSNEGLPGLVEQSDFGLRVTLAIALPVVFIISVVAVPLLKIFYERGAFLPSATIAVSLVIPIVMLNEVLFRMIMNMVGRTFFVLKDTLTINWVSSVTIILYIIAGYYLTQRWGYWGLALAQPIQAGASIILACILLANKVKQFPFSRLLKSGLIYTGLSIVSSMAAWLVLSLLGQMYPLVQLILSATVAVLVYGALIYRLDHHMALSLWDMSGIPKLYSIVRSRVAQPNEATHI
jgi:putative peptidoglycan lipid II flippase